MGRWRYQKRRRKPKKMTKRRMATMLMTRKKMGKRTRKISKHSCWPFYTSQSPNRQALYSVLLGDFVDNVAWPYVAIPSSVEFARPSPNFASRVIALYVLRCG